MSKVVVYMSMSLDGYVAAEGDGPGQGLGGPGGERLHAWLTAGNNDPASHQPESGVNAEVFDELMASGAVITGRHTFEWAGEWGHDHHDGVAIFVLTRSVPDDADQGIVHYRSDLEAAVAEAKAAAGDRHVMVHGATSVQALLEHGLVDELVVSLVPVLLGGGRRLFGDQAATLRLVDSREGVGVTHLRFAVERA